MVGLEARRATSEGRRGLKAILLAYSHVAAVFAAFALVALVDHLVEIHWRGLLAELVAAWGEYVRPAVARVLDVLIALPLRFLFGIHVTFPVIVQDYLAAGMVLILSWVRSAQTVGDGVTDWAEGYRIFIASVLALVFIGTLLFWPLLVLFFVLAALRSTLDLIEANKATEGREWQVARSRQQLSSQVLTLLPFIYLGLLLAVNNWLLR